MNGIAGEQEGQRSHARRNHEVLVATAREVFAERGAEASLEEIARRAGVGDRHALPALRDARRADRGGLRAAHRRLRRDRRGARRPSPTPGSRSSASSRGRSSCRPAIACSRTSSCARRRAAGRVEQRARGDARGWSRQVLERARERGRLRADFTLADLVAPDLVVRAADRRHGRGRAERLAAAPALAARRPAQRGGDAAGRAAAHATSS